MVIKYLLLVNVHPVGQFYIVHSGSPAGIALNLLQVGQFTTQIDVNCPESVAGTVHDCFHADVHLPEDPFQVGIEGSVDLFTSNSLPASGGSVFGRPVAAVLLYTFVETLGLITHEDIHPKGGTPPSSP